MPRGAEVTRRRVLFVGRTRYRLPLRDDVRRKWDALRERLDVRVLASGARGGRGGDETFSLMLPFPVARLDGLVYYVTLAFRVARELRRSRPEAVVAESPYEGAGVLLASRLAGVRPRLVVEVHGDWRTSTRLYGARGRRLVAPAGDRVAEHVLRRADALRAISGYTERLLAERGLPPAAVFPTYSDLGVFAGEPAPLPGRPQAIFVGVLEAYKNVEGLAAAWRRAAPRVPEARLLLVGDGTLEDVPRRLVADLPEQTEWVRRLEPPELRDALDASWALLLPSRAEGLGRVVIEAFLRGRPVVGGAVGGIPDLVAAGENGLLVDPADVDGLADAIVRLLSDRPLVERLGARARETGLAWNSSPEEYAERVAALVEAAVG